MAISDTIQLFVFENGLLRIALPKREEAKQRRHKINAR